MPGTVRERRSRVKPEGGRVLWGRGEEMESRDLAFYGTGGGGEMESSDVAVHAGDQAS
jgi:hypothetical protein